MSIEVSLIAILVLLLVIIALLVLMLFRTASWEKALLGAMTEFQQKRRHVDLQKLLEQRNYESLFQSARTKLKSNPSDPELLWYQGLGAFHLGRYELALESMKEGIRLEPSFQSPLEPYISQMEGRKPDAP